MISSIFLFYSQPARSFSYLTMKKKKKNAAYHLVRNAGRREILQILRRCCHLHFPGAHVPRRHPIHQGSRGGLPGCRRRDRLAGENIRNAAVCVCVLSSCFYSGRQSTHTFRWIFAHEPNGHTGGRSTHCCRSVYILFLRHENETSIYIYNYGSLLYCSLCKTEALPSSRRDFFFFYFPNGVRFS